MTTAKRELLATKNAARPNPNLVEKAAIKNAGEEVPLSETTKAGEVEPISTEKVAQGEVEAIPTLILPPFNPPIPPPIFPSVVE